MFNHLNGAETRAVLSLGEIFLARNGPLWDIGTNKFHTMWEGRTDTLWQWCSGPTPVFTRVASTCKVVPGTNRVVPKFSR